MITVRKKTYSGVVCELEVWRVREGTDVARAKPPRPRFADEAERRAHREKMALRRFIRRVNATFRPGDLYLTLTFDREHEVHTFDEARVVRASFLRRLKYRYPDAVIALVMGRGYGGRIHFHALLSGVPAEAISELWKCGKVTREDDLRMNCRYDGVDHGPDYTGLAVYLFNHWTAEQGGHHYYMSRNASEPQQEEPVEAKRSYCVDRPPYLRGYKCVEARDTAYGYISFKYVRYTEEELKKMSKRGRGGAVFA